MNSVEIAATIAVAFAGIALVLAVYAFVILEGTRQTAIHLVLEQEEDLICIVNFFGSSWPEYLTFKNKVLNSPAVKRTLLRSSDAFTNTGAKRPGSRGSSKSSVVSKNSLKRKAVKRS